MKIFKSITLIALLSLQCINATAHETISNIDITEMVKNAGNNVVEFCQKYSDEMVLSVGIGVAASMIVTIMRDNYYGAKKAAAEALKKISYEDFCTLCKLQNEREFINLFSLKDLFENGKGFHTLSTLRLLRDKISGKFLNLQYSGCPLCQRDWHKDVVKLANDVCYDIQSEIDSQNNKSV